MPNFLPFSIAPCPQIVFSCRFASRAQGILLVMTSLGNLLGADGVASIRTTCFTCGSGATRATCRRPTTARSNWDVVARLPAKYSPYLDLVDMSAESGLETKARLRLRALGIPYRAQVRISRVGHVDLLIGERLVLELDGGAWHSGPLADWAEPSTVRGAC